MSRSRKHQPYIGTGCGSDAQDKRLANRGYRRRCRVLTQQGAETLPLVREHADPWNWTMDGKHRVGPGSAYPWWRK